MTRRTPAALALLLLLGLTGALFASAGSAAGQDFGPPGEPDAEELRVRGRLGETSVSLEFEQAPLSTVLDFLSEATGVPMALATDVRDDEPAVTVAIQRLPGDRALDLVLALHGLRWKPAEDGGIVVVKPAALAVLRIYAVQDLTAAVPPEGLPPEAMEQLAGLDIELLAAHLRRVCGEDAWDGEGLAMETRSGTLIVRQLEPVHDRLVAELSRLRGARTAASPDAPPEFVARTLRRLQSQRVSVDLVDAIVGDAIAFVGNITGRQFTVRPEVAGDTVSVTARDARLTTVLDLVADTAERSWWISDRGHVVVGPRPARLPAAGERRWGGAAADAIAGLRDRLAEQILDVDFRDRRLAFVVDQVAVRTGEDVALAEGAASDAWLTVVGRASALTLLELAAAAGDLRITVREGPGLLLEE